MEHLSNLFTRFRVASVIGRQESLYFALGKAKQSKDVTSRISQRDLPTRIAVVVSVLDVVCFRVVLEQELVLNRLLASLDYRLIFAARMRS